VLLLDDPMQVVRHPDIDVVVEAMGGTGAARDCVLAAIAHGKHVVTANKALLALHGEEIFAAARAQACRWPLRARWL
jgi:homoserine dehydrogenase